MPIRAENRARYPADWAAISADIRFVRAGGRCECTGECATRGAVRRACLSAALTGERCQAVHGGWSARGTRVVLTTAHLDDTPENVGGDNLRAMCQACHLAYDIGLHVKKRRSLLDSDTVAIPPEGTRSQ